LAGIAPETLEQLRPWLAAYELEHAYQKRNGQTGLSANQVLAAEAMKAGVPVRSEFPTQEDTIAGYGALSPIADLQFLRFTLDEILAGPAKLRRENADWARGAIGLATERVQTAGRKFPELYDELFVQRNRRWTPRIADMLQQHKPSLIVVGNYHLLGPDGVLVLLGRNGLKLERA